MRSIESITGISCLENQQWWMKICLHNFEGGF